MRNEIPGETGFIKLSLALLGACAILTIVQGIWIQWLPAVAAIYAAWRVAHAINN
jgi:hypothetical protein